MYVRIMSCWSVALWGYIAAGEGQHVWVSAPGETGDGRSWLDELPFRSPSFTYSTTYTNLQQHRNIGNNLITNICNYSFTCASIKIISNLGKLHFIDI